VARALLIAFAAPFAAAGVFLAVMAARAGMAHQPAIDIVLPAGGAAAFGAVGFGLLIAVFTAPKAAPVGGPIPDRGERSAVTLWLFALMWNGVSAPIYYFVPQSIAKGNHMAAIGFIFPLVGLGIAIAAIRATLETVRFGESFFIADALPVPVGGTLRGNVLVRRATDVLADARSITARLTCYQRTRSGRDTTESILCRNECSIEDGSLQRTAHGLAIPIAIDVPPEGQSTDGSVQGRAIYWKLNVDADVPGVDYNATFDVPVFGSVPVQRATPRPAATAPRLTSVVERRTADGVEFDFPPFRARGPALFVLLFTALWVGAIAFMLRLHAPIVFPIFFGLFAVFLLWMLVDLLLGATKVRLTDDRVHVRSSLLFFHSDRDFARDDIDDVRTKMDMQMTGGKGETYYGIDIALKDGTTVAAGKYLADKREAEWVAQQIKG